MDRTRRRTAGLLVAAMVLVTAACNGETTKPSELSDDSSTSAAPSTAAPSTSTSPEQQAVIAQYKGYYDAIYTLTTPSEEQVRAALASFAIEPVIDNWVSVFSKLNSEGRRPGGHVSFGSIDVVVDGNIAVTRECRDSTTELIVAADNGETQSHGNPGTLIEGQLERGPSGTWLVNKAVATEFAC